MYFHTNFLFLFWNPTTSFLTATTLIYAIGAGITAAAGTRLALQLILVKGFKLYSFQLQDLKGPALLFIVTTSPCRDWVICAPAAFLGCGSRFSGSLSGIEPLFPVTRWNHGRPLSYHRKLIGQIFEWSIAGTRPCDSRSYYESPRERRTALVFYLINTPLPEVGALTHVLALELPQLSM